MKRAKVLIVDDEDRMRLVLKTYLKTEGYEVDEARDGRDALEKIKGGSFSMILLDVMMPGIDGWSVCKELRKFSSVPVIMLTARSEEYDKLFGFELGVDDYITKPFSPKEMIARIKAVLRRTEAAQNFQEDVIEYGSVRIDMNSKQAFVGQDELNLTPKEFDLLALLVRNPGRVYNRQQLLNIIWGYDYYGDIRTVDTHIKQLREKLRHYKDHIQTIWGTGYKFIGG